jgi:beta-lactam-binding protein with PASTA domain
MLMKQSQMAHVVLSLGQRQLQIPLLEGNTLRASRIELLRTGLQVGEVSSISSSAQPVDTVVVQSPRPGGGASTPKVDVLVSQGSPEPSFVMPRLIGLAETDAQHRLDVAGLRRKVNYVAAPQWPHAQVIDQSPAPGQRISASALIELTVAN